MMDAVWELVTNGGNESCNPNITSCNFCINVNGRRYTRFYASFNFVTVDDTLLYIGIESAVTTTLFTDAIWHNKVNKIN